MSTRTELAIAAALALLCGGAWFLNLEFIGSIETTPVLLCALLAIRIVPLGVLIGMGVRQPLVGLIVGVASWLVLIAGIFWLAAALSRA